MTNYTTVLNLLTSSVHGNSTVNFCRVGIEHKIVCFYKTRILKKGHYLSFSSILHKKFLVEIILVCLVLWIQFTVNIALIVLKATMLLVNKYSLEQVYCNAVQCLLTLNDSFPFPLLLNLGTVDFLYFIKYYIFSRQVWIRYI